MFPRPPSLRLLILLGVVSGSVGSVFGQAAARSPFLPPQSAGAATPTAGAPLEFRGYIETSDGMLFRIYDPAKKSAAWVKLNERNPEFDVLVKQHDGNEKTLTLEHQGKTLTLAERKSKVVSSGSPAMAVPPPAQPVAAAPNVAPAVTDTVVLNPTPADEQKRLEAVAAEVQRRRALREQAAQQLAPGAVAQPAVPQAVPQPAPVNAQGQRNFRPPPPPNRQQR